MELLAQIKRSTFVQACFAISYLSSGIIINILQSIIFVCVKPFDKTLYRKLLYYLCYSLNCQLVFIADWWGGLKLLVYIDPEVKKNYVNKEHVLLLMNHSYEIDWLIGWIFCEKANVLGNCKAYAKKAIQYIPVVGWSWKFAEFIFLERSYEKDKVIIARQIKEILDYPSPVWLLLNAEGTRFTPKKHEASVKFAQERGLPILKHHLTPRTKGFTTSLPHLKEKCPAILDIQIGYNDEKIEPTLSNLLMGKAGTAHLLVRRIPTKSLPDTEQEAADWLHNLYSEKDKIQDSFYKYGNFFEGTGVKPVEGELMKPRLSSLVNTLGWAFVILVPMFYYLAKFLFNGELMYFSIGVGIFLGFHLLMNKIIYMSGKKSSYGASNIPAK